MCLFVVCILKVVRKKERKTQFNSDYNHKNLTDHLLNKDVVKRLKFITIVQSKKLNTGDLTSKKHAY